MATSYASGAYAPGRAEPAAVHHLNLAHGLGAQAVRSVLPSARADIARVADWSFVRPGGEAIIHQPLDVVRPGDGVRPRSEVLR